MSQVSVTVNGRSYPVGCEDGEEDHLRDLARYLDKRVKELAGSVGQIGETRLFLIAGLTVADDLSEALARIEDLEEEVARLRSGQSNVHDDIAKVERRAAELIEGAARRLEDIAGRLEAS